MSELPGHRAARINKSLKEGDWIRFCQEERFVFNNQGFPWISLPAGTIGKIIHLFPPDQWGSRKGNVLFKNGVVGHHFGLYGGFEVLSVLEVLALETDDW